MARESVEAAEARWLKLELLQRHYKSFTDFMSDAMHELGFSSTEMQEDIANYLQHGPQYLMIQAQRGEAKSTITALYAIWCLIHDPKHRVLIVSAGGTQSKEIATMIQRLLFTWDILDCLKPDPNNGDRTSVEGFDVHYTLKGVDKSPSVACVGILGNLPGKRADLLIADDIESTKNSRTAAMREILVTLANEFPSICSTGRIVYLGTPQTSESIYNNLAGKGYAIRIWPGRYPTPAQMSNYGNHLAPYLRQKMEADPSLCFGGGLAGDKGKPTDPKLLDEHNLCAKEANGEAYFQLNFMLNTTLSDQMRYPLKTEHLVVLGRCDGVNFPMSIVRGMTDVHLKDFTSSGFAFRMSTPQTVSDDLGKLEGIMMRVDPAGGGKNADESGYAVTGYLNGNIYVLATGGVPGGYSEDALKALADVADKYKPNIIQVEKNMGHGAFTQVWLPILRKMWKGTVEDEFVSGQKEARIIDTLEPVMGRGSLIFLEDVVREDDMLTEKYHGQTRITYSLFHQLSKLTRQKGCLGHDDRLDALEGAVRYWVKRLGVDQDAAAAAKKKAQLDEFMKDPRQRWRCEPHAQRPRTGPNLLNRFKR